MEKAEVMAHINSFIVFPKTVPLVPLTDHVTITSILPNVPK